MQTCEILKTREDELCDHDANDHHEGLDLDCNKPESVQHETTCCKSEQRIDKLPSEQVLELSDPGNYVPMDSEQKMLIFRQSRFCKMTEAVNQQEIGNKEPPCIQQVRCGNSSDIRRYNGSYPFRNKSNFDYLNLVKRYPNLVPIVKGVNTSICNEGRKLSIRYVKSPSEVDYGPFRGNYVGSLTSKISNSIDMSIYRSA